MEESEAEDILVAGAEDGAKDDQTQQPGLEVGHPAEGCHLESSCSLSQLQCWCMVQITSSWCRNVDPGHLATHRSSVTGN